MLSSIPKVFVSSRISPDELASERTVAFETIERMGLKPILFEKESGSSKHCFEWWREQIQDAEIFLLLLDRSLSDSVLDEFKTARKTHPEKPILVYVKQPAIIRTKSLEIVSSNSSAIQGEVEWFYQFVLNKKWIPTEQFSRKLEESLWKEPKVYGGLGGDIRKNEFVFVPPSNYDRAAKILDSNKILIITGPAHIGKTFLGLKLLCELKKSKKISTISKLNDRNDYKHLSELHNTGVLLDDPFGGSDFSQKELAENFQDVEQIAVHNYIVIPTRSNVLAEAQGSTKLGEHSDLPKFVCEIDENNYDNYQREEILKRHCNYMLRTHFLESEQITNAQMDLVNDNLQYIIGELHFPHNIEQFACKELKNVFNKQTLYEAVERAKEIEKAVAVWFRNLDPQYRLATLIAVLMPQLEEEQYFEALKFLFDTLKEKKPEIPLVYRFISTYFTTGEIIIHKHPSYRDGILKYVCQDEPELVGQVISKLAKWAVQKDLIVFIKLHQSKEEIFKKNILINDPRKYFIPEKSKTEEYFQAIVSTYQNILKKNFPKLQRKLLPNISGDIGLKLYLNSSGEIIGWHFKPANPFAAVEIDRTGISPLSDRKFSGIVHMPSSYDCYSIPELYAFGLLFGQISELLRKHNLFESWQFVYVRAYKNLSDLETPIFSSVPPTFRLDLAKTITESIFKEAVEKRIPEDELLKLGGWPPRVGLRPRSEDIYLPHLVGQIRFLDSAGHSIDGPLLPAPDIKIDKVISKTGTVVTTDLYTDASLKIAANRFFSIFLQSYKMMAQTNFPRLYSFFHLYNRMPVKVVCVIEREEISRFDKGNVFYMILQSNPEDEFEVEVFIISDDVSSEEQEEGKRKKKMILDLHHFPSNCLEKGVMRLSIIVNSNDLMHEVYQRLERDFSNTISGSL